MDYGEIKLKIKDECTNMLSVTTTDITDYTHQPSNEYIIQTIESSISELKNLINNIKEK